MRILKAGSAASSWPVSCPDMCEGITKILKEKNIQNGWVAMIGSLEKTSYYYLEKNDAKLGAGYGAANERTFPVELCNAMGLICEGGLHIHASMCSTAAM